jgi:hypothetical protein
VVVGVSSSASLPARGVQVVFVDEAGAKQVTDGVPELLGSLRLSRAAVPSADYHADRVDLRHGQAPDEDRQGREPTTNG